MPLGPLLSLLCAKSPQPRRNGRRVTDAQAVTPSPPTPISTSPSKRPQDKSPSSWAPKDSRQPCLSTGNHQCQLLFLNSSLNVQLSFVTQLVFLPLPVGGRTAIPTHVFRRLKHFSGEKIGMTFPKLNKGEVNTSLQVAVSLPSQENNLSST